MAYRQGPKSRYGEKLLDPRWQKVRLEVLARDKFTCQVCNATEKTLHVHHIAYQGCDPWETDTELLLTLCAECHEAETVDHPSSVASMLELLARMGVRTAFQLDILNSNIDMAYCDQATGNWPEAWREGVRRHLAGWPFTKD